MFIFLYTPGHASVLWCSWFSEWVSCHISLACGRSSCAGQTNYSMWISWGKEKVRLLWKLKTECVVQLVRNLPLSLKPSVKHRSAESEGLRFEELIFSYERMFQESYRWKFIEEKSLFTIWRKNQVRNFNQRVFFSSLQVAKLLGTNVGSIQQDLSILLKDESIEVREWCHWKALDLFNVKFCILLFLLQLI